MIEEKYGKDFVDVLRNEVIVHLISKRETNTVESFNSSLRDRLGRLGRKSKGYSKNQEMLEYSLVLWKERKNAKLWKVKKYVRSSGWREFIEIGWVVGGQTRMLFCNHCKNIFV
ncbi:hypothetical protein FACS1894152_5820 [Bacilli bacterium]|nr:hypothetical protein FACS1894152_5820 [Bacilli bacterium]